MTLSTLNEILKSAGYPVKYGHFIKPPKYPCITYSTTDEQYVYSKNTQAIEFDEITINLYCSEKPDRAAEIKLETALKSNGIVFERYRFFIDADEVYSTEYTITILQED